MGENRTPLLKLEPRGLSLPDAAAYLGVSSSLFSEMVSDGRLPPPKQINRRRVWDRRRLDEAFDMLPERPEVNPWDTLPSKVTQAQ